MRDGKRVKHSASVAPGSGKAQAVIGPTAPLPGKSSFFSIKYGPDLFGDRAGHRFNTIHAPLPRSAFCFDIDFLSKNFILTADESQKVIIYSSGVL